MRQKILAITMFAVVLGLCSCAGAGDSAKASTQPAAPPVVPVVKAGRSDLATDLALTAEFQPFQQVDVIAKVAGYVGSIKVDIGDRVREGQVLATLEIPEMQDDLTKAAATIDQNEAEIATASDELRRAEAAHEAAHLSF